MNTPHCGAIIVNAIRLRHISGAQTACVHARHASLIEENAIPFITTHMVTFGDITHTDNGDNGKTNARDS